MWWNGDLTWNMRLAAAQNVMGMDGLCIATLSNFMGTYDWYITIMFIAVIVVTINVDAVVGGVVVNVNVITDVVVDIVFIINIVVISTINVITAIILASITTVITFNVVVVIIMIVGVLLSLTTIFINVFVVIVVATPVIIITTHAAQNVENLQIIFSVDQSKCQQEFSWKSPLWFMYVKNCDRCPPRLHQRKVRLLPYYYPRALT